MASPTKDTDLVDDLFGKSDNNLLDDFEFADEDLEEVDKGTGDKSENVDKCESESEDEAPVETVPRKTNLKKTNMERSFEDLLNGLSDESDPELEDIIPDDIDNTNLESLLGTPDKSYRDIRPDTSEFTPKQMDDPFGMDVISSTPNVRKTAESPVEIKMTPPEVRLHTPEDEDEAFDISADRNFDDADANVVDDTDDVDNDVEMRTKPSRKSTLSSGDDVDLEVIEDTNHLDVDVSKHKSALGKKGSLALRRKPSRKSRKSLLSTGEDAIFQDSTDAKVEMMNGDDDDDDDDERFDLSPPAKKPSPVSMMPLPGLAGRPPSQRLSSSNAEDEEDTKEVKRKSKPPPGAFVLPPMGASPKKPLRPSSESGEKSPRESKPTTFEKPALKPVKPTDRSRSPVRDATPSFSRGGLRSTDKSDVEMKSANEDRDVTFQKPSLRSTPKPSRDRTPEQTMDTNAGNDLNNGMFEKPALRNTPKPKLEQKPNHPEELEDVFATKNLRSVPKPDNFAKDMNGDNHLFDKPQLKTPKVDSDGDNKHDSSSKYREKTFEKPTLRSTNKKLRSDSMEEPGYEPSHTFEKPTLRTAGGRTAASNKQDNFTSGMFEKPSLKKTTPSPEKEVKDINEPKGMFDRPQLRKTDSLKEREEKAKTADKPSWLQKASDKHGRALDVLQTKENHSNSEKQVPSWLEKSPLRKNKALPLQDTSNNQSTSSSQSDLSTEDYVKSTSSTPRSRNSSQGTENEPERKASLPVGNNNYTPGWMRQTRSPSVPTTGGVSPAKSMPALNESNEVPQWKRELAQRRQNRKDKITEDLPKKVDNAEPEWKKGIMLRKTRNTAQPSKETHSVEPEWKKAAEEKRQRLRNTGVDKTEH